MPTIRVVIDLRRGMDLIETLHQLDGQPILCMGQGVGESMRGIPAGVPDRIRAHALLMAGGDASPLPRQHTRSGGLRRRSRRLVQ